MKKFIFALCIIGSMLFTTKAQAQYTLVNNDVEVVNGTITKCTYNFAITNIVIPDSLNAQKITGIGSEVFQHRDGIPQITGIVLPEGIEKIGNYAFRWNIITSLSIPTTVTIIGNGAFENNNINTLTIPANVQAIGNSAFHDCKISNLTIEEGVVKIGEYAFNNNNIPNLIIPNSVTDLGYAAFQINKIVSLTIGSGVRHIGHRTFWNNDITTLEIPDGVTHIEDGAFADNNITSLTIPASVAYINAPFSGNAITEVNEQPSKGIIFARHENGSINNTKIASYGGVANVIDFIPETVTIINGNSFQRNGLTTVTIPATVLYIDHSAFAENSISSLTLNEGLKSIWEMAFYNNNITSLTIPSTVNSLGGGFVNMNTITTINGEATNGIIYALNQNGTTDSTKVISYAGSEKVITADIFPEGLTTIGNNSFQGSQLTSVIIPSNVKIIEYSAFANNYITEVTIPQGVTTIWHNAFEHNRLDQIVIPNSVETLESYAFNNNYLTDVTLPNSITEIQSGVFNSNRLTGISIPSSVTYIGADAFANNQITSLTINSNITEISRYAFSNNNLSNINIPGNVERIGEGTFSNNNLTSLTLNDGLKIMGKNAFSDNNLTQSDLALPASLSSIGKNAFSNNNGLDSIYLHEPTAPGFIKWVDGYEIDQNINTWVKDLNTSYIADVEHTLTDSDIEIVDGIIHSVNYDIRANKITIPRILKNQVVLGIRSDNDINSNWLGGLFQDKNLKSINLPTSILQIGNNAFSDNNLKSITIPDSVKYIGQSAFSNNPKIASLTLPNPQNENFIEWTDNNNTVFTGGSIVYNLNNSYTARYKYTLTDDDVVMQNGAIISCSYNFVDKSIIIPETLDGQTVVKIAEVWKENEDGQYMEGMFQSKDIISIKLPATLDTIGQYAFAWNKLNYIEIPENVKHIDNEAFRGNKIDSIVMPNSIPTKLAVFNDNKVKKLNGNDIDGIFYKVNDDGSTDSTTIAYYGGDEAIIDFIDETVLHVSHSAFSWCNLTQVSLTTQIITIGNYAFNGSHLTKISIPNSVTYIGDGAFAEGEISEITLPTPQTNDFEYWYDNSNPVNKYEAGAVVTNLWNSYTALFKYTLTNDDVVMLNGAIVNCNYNFSSKYLVIPETLDGQQVIKIGEVWKDDGDGPYSYGMFQDKGLMIVELPATIDTIGEFAFAWNKLDSIAIPEGTKYIDDWAFQGNTASSVIIPDSVTYISYGAFADGGITEITLPNPQTDDFLFWYDNDGNRYNGGETTSNLYNTYAALIKYTLTNDDVVMQNGAIISTSFNFKSKYLVIPDTLDGQQIVKIAEILKDNGNGPYIEGMFQSRDDKHLLAVELPATIDTIGEYAFAWNRLDSITIPKGVRYINNYAFQGNQLPSVIIPDSVTYIGNGAFADCEISEITLPNPQTDDFIYWYDHDGNRYNGGETTSNLWNSFTALIKYTLTNDDVVMQNGAIIENQYDYRSKYIIIPDTLDGQQVVKIAEIWKENEDGPYIEGMFQGHEGKELLAVELPTTLDTIGEFAFAWNILDSIILPENTKYINHWAFTGNRISNVNLPNRLTFLGEGAFSDNNAELTEIMLPTAPENYTWTDYDGNIYVDGDVITNFYSAYWLKSMVSNKELFGSSNITMYPNPAKTKLTIICPANSDNLKLTIYYATGAIVYKNNSWYGESINVSGLDNGIYLVKITNKHGKLLFNKMFIKK